MRGSEGLVKTNGFVIGRRRTAALLLPALFPCAAVCAAIEISTVPVGNVGNSNDSATGLGAVSYAYNIGKYEVTVGQYAAFLNAVASFDPNNLFNINMQTDANSAGIARSGVLGSYTYSVFGSAEHPITYVDWADAARFANWLHNGQPTGGEVAGTTETGAYTLNGANGQVWDSFLSSVPRNAGAKWFIPTQNEWYKAAYHQPAAQGGDSDSYWTYPVKSNSTPYSDQPPGGTPDNTRVANFYQDDGKANGYDDGWAVPGSTTYSQSQNLLTDVGAYTSSASYYGTFDQGGNVMEWDETKVTITTRGLRGGSWRALNFDLDVMHSRNFTPSTANSEVGFRVATIIPEPSSAALSGLAGVVGFHFFARRNRWRPPNC